MVAAVVAASLDHRRAAELAAPDHERVLQHSALLQVLDQRRARLVGLLAVVLDVAHQAVVLVPRFVEDLDEPHPALQQPPRQQAGVGERRLARLGTVQFEDVLGLVADVHHARCALLHAEGHLVRADPRGDLGIADFLEPHAVERLNRVERVALELARRSRGGSTDTSTGSPLVAELHSLINGRQESASPVGIAAAGPFLAGAEDDESGQVL